MKETTYRVGMYIRLSREDEEKEDSNAESESISNQRSFILDFLKENNYTLYDEYVDDGFSGTNFNRPGFKRLIQDIEAGKINMVVTKDMSRLGRDYIGFGDYIEKWFPEHNVRYIAITDNVDTFADGIGNDIVPFKAIMNDMYSKDISKKVKASITTKKKNGQFLGSHAPYGYKKDPNNKYKLIIDKEASVVVKRIYDMYLSGVSLHEIARILTDEKITKPSVYLGKKVIREDLAMIWDVRSIYDILSNPNYTGDLVQGRHKKVNYKSKKLVKAPKSQWITAYNTHEAIIDKKTFELVQAIHEKNRLIHKNEKKDDLLKGFLYCKECGHTLGINHNGAKQRYIVCNYYRKYSKQGFCTSHSMRYEEIEKIVLKEVRNLCKQVVDTKRLENILKNNDKKKKAIENLDIQIKQAKKVIQDNTDFLYNSYLDKLKGIITTEMYQKLANSLSEEMKVNQELVNKLEKEQQELKDNKVNNNSDVKKIVNDYLALKKVDRNLLANIIDYITVDKDKNIEIHFKIQP